MSDYCQQCSIEYYGEDSCDLAPGDDDAAAVLNGNPGACVYVVMCEGCNVTGSDGEAATFTPYNVPYTLVDANGKCVADCTKHHGNAETLNGPYGSYGQYGAAAS